MHKIFIIILFIGISLSGYSQLDQKMILFLPFSGNAKDMSGHENHGAVHGATLTQDRFGNSNCAYYFDGEDDYIEIQASSSLNSFSGFVSISAWVKPISRYYNTIISKGSSMLTFQLVKYLRPGILFHGLDIDYSGVEKYWDRILLYDEVPENEWTHLVCIYDSMKEQVEMYINGKLSHNCHATGSIESGDGNLTIGVRLSDIFPEYFHGVLDDIRIYSRSLVEEEVNILFNDAPCTNYVTVYDTVKVYRSIAVTDTLYIDFKYNYSSIYIKVYPNPTNDIITVDTGGLLNTMKLKMRITNSIGQILIETSLKDEKHTVKLSQFGATGVYYISILNANDESLAVRKIILR